MSDDERELHPQARAVLDTVDELGVLPFSRHSVERAREISEQLRSDAPGPELGGVEDRTVPGPDGNEVPVRIYRPTGDGPLPAVVYFHGGGFVFGGLDSHDLLCRHLAAETEAVVAAVDYRLAPEHPFPAAARDAYAATAWADDHPDDLGSDGRLAVAGDSAGGTLAAVVSLLARDRGGPDLAHQALVYPGASPEDWPSREENAEGYFLELADVEWFYDHYFPTDVHARNPYALPMNACDLSGLPSATVVSAGFDPLRDEDRALADRLDGAGVPVERRPYPDMIHGFFGMLAPPADLDRAHEAVAAVAADLRASFENAA